MRRPVWSGSRRRIASVASFSSSVLLIGALVASSAWATPVTIGNDPSADPIDPSFIPFGALTPELQGEINLAVQQGDQLPVPRFQQVYDASVLASKSGDLPFIISEISFDMAVSQLGGAGLLGGTTCSGGRTECGLFTLRLSTARDDLLGIPLPVNGLSESGPYDPLFPDAQQDVFDGNMSAAMTEIFATQILLSDVASGGVQGGKLTFTGDPFYYDPLAGENLLLDIQITDFGTTADLTQGLSTLFFDANDLAGFGGSPPFSQVDNFDGLDNSSFGLITTLEISTIPEPGTAVLLGLGLAALSHQRIRRRRR